MGPSRKGAIDQLRTQQDKSQDKNKTRQSTSHRHENKQMPQKEAQGEGEKRVSSYKTRNTKVVNGTWVVRIRCSSRHVLIYNAIPKKRVREMRDGGRSVRVRARQVSD